MKRTITALALLNLMLAGCEQKASPPAEQAGSNAPTQHQHINTNRAAFKAAGRAAKQLEQKGEDRNSAADEAMKAGQ